MSLMTNQNVYFEFVAEEEKTGPKDINVKQQM
jgi:hypothetical protein